MLIGSHSRLHYFGRTRQSGPALVNGYVRTNWQQSGRRYNAHSAFGELASEPVGYLHPYAVTLPRAAGGLGSTQQIAGTATITLNLAGGRNAEAALAGSGSITSAIGDLIVSAIATLTGSGAIVDADVRAVLQAAATLAGSGDLDGALEALGELTGQAAGTSGMTVVPYATGELEAELSATGAALTPASIADAVWSSDAGRFLYALGRNKVITDPVAGTYTVYADDDTTVLYQGDLWQDAAGTTPYAGAGAERRDRLV